MAKDYPRLRELLGEDVTQLTADEMKERIGKKIPDSRPATGRRTPTPWSNESYPFAVAGNASDYFNTRVDAVQNAEIEDTLGNVSPQELADVMSKRLKTDKVPVKIKDMSELEKQLNSKLYGAFLPDKHEIEINKKLTPQEMRSTVAHEMKHARDAKNNTMPIQNTINEATNLNFNAPTPLDIPPIRRIEIEGLVSNPQALDQAVIDQDFKKVSDLYNTGHFVGNDQIDDIASRTYAPTGWKKLTDTIIKGRK